MTDQLRDRVAIVTGASSGIGRAVGNQLFLLGANVVGVSRAGVSGALAVHEGGTTSRYVSVQADLLDPKVADDVVTRAVDHFGRVDYLVNAAGVLTWGRADTTTDAVWHETIEVNLTAAFRMIRSAAEWLKLRHGAVVNVSSINSYRPFTNTAAYSVSKAGLDQLTRVAAAELAPEVRVNAVNPGVVVTNLHLRSGMPEATYVEFLQRSKETHPLGRPGAVADIAEAVVFLLQAEWITGVTLPVDGGRHLTVLR